MHHLDFQQVALGLGWTVPTETQKLGPSVEEAEERPVMKAVGREQ